MGGGVSSEAPMTAPLSRDLRRRIARSVAQGSSIGQAAARYEVSPSAAVKLLQRVRKTGSLAPDRIGGHRRPVLEPHPDLLRSLIARSPASRWRRSRLS